MPVPRQFDVVIERDEEGYYVASVPQLPGCHTQARSLDEVSQRIREAIGGEPFRAGGSVFGITCSLGISWRDPASPEDADALISEADLALYNAKARGRNRVESHAPVLAEA